MLNLTRPRYVMPFHGDHKRIHLHGRLAEAVGVDADDDLQGRERPAAGARRHGARFGKPEHSGMIFVDGVDIGDPADVALRDRRMLSADGIFVVVATISEQDGSSVAEPEVIFRGVPFLEDADEMLDEIRDTVEASLARAAERGDPRDRPAPAGPARRPRGVRLRAPAPPADGAAGRRRGLDGADAHGRGRSARRRGRGGRRPARRAARGRQPGLRARRGRALARGDGADHPPRTCAPSSPRASWPPRARTGAWSAACG